METGLQDRNVLVSGASGGIGSELARAFLREGARVAAHYHSHAERVQKELATAPGRWVALGADLTKEAEVATLFANAERDLGPIHVLIANAGYWPPEDTPVHQMTLEQWNRTLAVDLTSVFLCMREFFRGIVKHGLTDPAAVLVGSTAGMFGEAGHADYATAKAGLTYGLARSLKNEICRLAPRGRLNVVCPGWTVTPMIDRFTANPGKVRRVLQTIPLRKVARPSDVAAAVLFLASPTLAGHVSGQIIPVTGGMEGRVLYEPNEIDIDRA
jgi:3-oxoacyl-[acyl-carrier protein] reductase